MRTTATLADQAIRRFDATLGRCRGAGARACSERAWAVVVSNVGWLPFSLLPLAPRSRGCAPLAQAFEALDGFNLGAVQLDYSAPDQVDGALRATERLALVDGLRPVPAELREASEACRH